MAAIKLFHIPMWVMTVSFVIQYTSTQDATTASPNVADRYKTSVFETGFPLTRSGAEKNAQWISCLVNCGVKLARVLRNPHTANYYKQFAFSFEQLIKKYFDSPYQDESEACEETFETLLTTVINHNIYDIGIRRLEIKHQFEDMGDTRTPDVVLQKHNGGLVIFEVKYCRGNALNMNMIEDMLKNATTQALGYADWYLYGKYQHLYNAPSAKVIVLLVTEYEKRVVLQTSDRLRDFFTELPTMNHWSN
ncbi:uncharacterized protein LOC135834523 [Planococcus citri]|uniref:uncharacterized protein LOC135834523 n=1 Tax=Planococcus citri TaxID=170843 RepID=UPI0031F94868